MWFISPVMELSTLMYILKWLCNYAADDNGTICSYLNFCPTERVPEVTFAFDYLVYMLLLSSAPLGFCQVKRGWEENVSLVDAVWLWLCCLVHPARHVVMWPQPFYLSQGIVFGVVFWVPLVAVSENLVLNPWREIMEGRSIFRICLFLFQCAFPLIGIN